MQYVRSLSRAISQGTRPACARHCRLTYSDGDAALERAVTNFHTVPHDRANVDFLRENCSWQGVVEPNELAM